MPQRIFAPSAPNPIGPYNQAIRSGEFVFCSGQVGLDPATSALVEGGITAQTHQVLRNLEAVLGASGLSLDDVVKTTIYLVDLADFSAVNRRTARLRRAAARAIDDRRRRAAAGRAR